MMTSDSRLILVTGGCGFIGSNFIRHLFQKSDFSGRIINLDKLTYAGNPENLADIASGGFSGRYRFIHGDIADFSTVENIFQDHPINMVVHFAAESHVDRSIHSPADFIGTNINGTFNLLECCRRFWGSREDTRFHHVSTDEVFGSLGPRGFFTETTPYAPRSPYSASKASSDHLAMAYCHTYGLPVTLSNCSNNYGPFQFPEKLIPLMILNAAGLDSLPVYGDGENIRDWLYVEDHCAAVWRILQYGRSGETYNIGGGEELTNLQVIWKICEIFEKISPLTEKDRKNSGLNHYRDLIKFVKDRPGHDRRYAIDSSKIRRELGWKPTVSFDQGIVETVKWYLENRQWVDHIRSGEYKKWLKKNYGKR